MSCQNCNSNSNITRVVYSCSGCADVGYIADDVGRKLRQTGIATTKSSCLAGIGAGIQSFIDAAKTANEVMTIDGCEVGCAKRVISNIGIAPKSIILTEMGLAKGQTTPTSELSNRLVADISILINP